MRVLGRGATAATVVLASCLGPVTPPGGPSDAAEETGTPPGGSATPAPATTSTEPGRTTSAAGSTTSGDGGSSSDTTRGVEPELVEVSHTREFRGAWVASAFNINFPTSPGASAAQQQEEVLEILDVLAMLQLNVVVLQVRPESDALYTSDLEPWSRFLTGTQGADPGYDPLQFTIDEAHDRGIEVHAWLNPFRAKTDTASTADATHVTQTLPEHAIEYGDQVWMDPGAQEVRDHVVDVALDLADRYDIDGIQTDDYYYPYPTAGPFPDDGTWQDYLQSGGELSLDQWRRDNVNRLIEALHDELLSAAPDVRFGAAPFGIYRPGVPPGISGLDQYTTLYADPVHWIQEGWVDFLTPQLYWATTQPQQAYDVLLEWWTSLAADGRHVFAGNAAYKLGTGPEWSADELLLQVELVREVGAPAAGNVFYNVEALLEDTGGLATALAESAYLTPALSPPLPREDRPSVDAPLVSATETGAEIDHDDRDHLRAFVVYLDAGDGFAIQQLLGPQTSSIELSPGRWAVSAADRLGSESLGAVVELP